MKNPIVIILLNGSQGNGTTQQKLQQQTSQIAVWTILDKCFKINHFLLTNPTYCMYWAHNLIWAG